MNTSFLFLLLGVGALFALGDAFSGSDSEGDENKDPPEQNDNETSADIRFGTEGDDLLFSAGGEVLDGLGGNDTLETTGDSTLQGGEGDDTLIAVGGGAVLTGGAGENTFIIEVLDVSDENELLDIDGQPVAPTEIDDFDPDTDRLVLDLRQSGLVPEDGEPVVLTGVVAPDGEGLMVQVDGVNVVQLSGYGGGDMQAALEALDTDFGALEVLGAGFEFPSEEFFFEGLRFDTDDEGNVILALSDQFKGGGTLGGGDAFNTLDMSALTTDMLVTVLPSGVIVVAPADGSWPATNFEEIDRIILGNGDDVFDGSDGPGGVEVIAGNGMDIITGSDLADVGNRLIGAGYSPGDDPAEGWNGIGPTDLVGGAGEDTLLGGLDDTLTGGEGRDLFQVWGYGAEGAGPTMITDFNPDEDRLEYSWVTPLDTEEFREITLADSEDGLLILEEGEVMVIIAGVTLADNPNISAGDRSISLPI